MLTGGAGAITGSGARDVTTAAVLVCEVMVVTAVATAAGSECDATCDTDAFDAVSVAESTGEDTRSVVVEMAEFGSVSTGSGFVLWAVRDGFVEESVSADSLFALFELLGVGVVVAACTTSSCGSLFDPA
jgi:hypothetical protein